MQKAFEFILEIIGWMAIVASPLLASIAIGIAVYLNNVDTTGLVIGISIVAIGLILGVVWATYVWKKHGTFEYISRIYGSPKTYPKCLFSNKVYNYKAVILFFFKLKKTANSEPI
ncbi:MAG: hypothetical protein ABFS35_07640 [Bacteroidota bacterium]